MRLIDTLKVENELGEGVIWDHAASKLWWTDIQQSKLYRYDPESKKLEQWDTPERLCCFAPRADSKGLVAAFESGFAFYTPESGELEWIKKLEADNPGTRFNDGRTDRQGRLWAATMVENDKIATYKGSLYCLDYQLHVHKTIGDLSIPNSLCWSPDGKTMYHTDTPSRQIKQFNYDIETATFDKSRNFVTTKQGCYPDGSIIDAEGYLWNAQWASSTVVRYAPNGSVDLVVSVPASQPTCVAFGGKNLNLMFVTSAWQDLDSQARALDSDAGSLFVFETDYLGLIENRFGSSPV
ncbi:MAG: sugar lactone lactonase YvrE [Arenicella sp.]|jgi:sugar lactone lactonase YvrE